MSRPDTCLELLYKNIHPASNPVCLLDGGVGVGGGGWIEEGVASAHMPRGVKISREPTFKFFQTLKLVHSAQF